MTPALALANEQSADAVAAARQCFPKFREIVPFHRHETYGGEMERSTAVIPRLKQEPSSHWLKDKIRIKQRLADALEEDHAHKQSHLKLIARETGASPRTVEGWKDATYMMGVEHFLRLIPSSPAIQRMLAELMTLDPDTDPRHAVVLNNLRRLG